MSAEDPYYTTEIMVQHHYMCYKWKHIP